MGNANSLFFSHLGERNSFYRVFKLEQGKIDDNPGNKMKFPFVHFCFDYLLGKIKIFLKCDVSRGQSS
jgi:hypothetical protein